jgi:hypothetical protein
MGDLAVVWVHYKNQDEVNKLAMEFSIWELDKDKKRISFMIHRPQYDILIASGYEVEIDNERTEGLNKGIY